MSKVIKQMQMNVLKNDFKDVRDLVVLNVVGLSAINTNSIRLALRKKGIRLQVVKNSLARRVFRDYGIEIKDAWAGATTIAWGSTSVAELSKEVQTVVKKHEKQIKVKTAVADGTEVPFEMALKMPTRSEAIANVLALAMSPGAQIAAAVLAPGGSLVSAIQGIKDMKKDEEAPTPVPAA
jgi:large subunit ribosomal protein L10